MQTIVVLHFLGMNAGLVALQTHHSLPIQGTKALHCYLWPQLYIQEHDTL